jgi:hypothetical protein
MGLRRRILSRTLLPEQADSVDHDGKTLRTTYLQIRRGLEKTFTAESAETAKTKFDNDETEAKGRDGRPSLPFAHAMEYPLSAFDLFFSALSAVRFIGCDCAAS